MTEPVQVVCVGAGWVTAHRHIPALRRHGRARVIGVVDPRPERAEAVARRHGIERFGTDLDEPWVRDATCATIGTPPDTHADVATALLDRGFHVLCEKPLTTTVQAAEDLVALAKRNDRVLAVVHNFQFASAMLRARRLLEQGDLGELSAVYAFQMSNHARRLPSWYPALAGGLFYDEAPHLLYLLRLLVGDLTPEHVTSRVDGAASPAQIEHIDVRFAHPTVWAQLVMNFRSPLSEWQLLVVGTKRLIAVDIFRDISVLLPNDEGHTPATILRTTYRGVGDHLAGVLRSGIGHVTGRLLYGNREVVDAFLRAVAGEPCDPAISGQSGLEIVRTMHEIMGRANVGGR